VALIAGGGIIAPMLTDEIKKRMFAAMKAGKTVEKEILRVAIGEITTAEARVGTAFSDADVQAILKKLCKGNEETLAVTEDAGRRAELEEELTVLRKLLPAALGVDEIVAALGPVTESVRGAKNDGQATGIAMKHLKTTGAAVDGKDVALAVARLRATDG
jgi:uncharacterized protein YqeY